MSPGSLNHRVNFSSNFLGIVIRLDCVDTLKIRLNGPHVSQFAPPSPLLKKSSSSRIDLTVFLVILGRLLLFAVQILKKPVRNVDSCAPTFKAFLPADAPVEHAHF